MTEHCLAPHQDSGPVDLVTWVSPEALKFPSPTHPSTASLSALSLGLTDPCLSVNMTSGDLGLSHHVAQLGPPLPLASGVPPDPCDALPTGCAPALTNTPTIRSVSFSRFLMPLAHQHNSPGPYPFPSSHLPQGFTSATTAQGHTLGPAVPCGHATSEITLQPRLGGGIRHQRRKTSFRQHPSGSPTADTLIC